MRNLALAWLTCLALVAPCGAQETVEEGRARNGSWSGSAWPLHKGGLIGPLAKYDQVTGASAAAWERQNKAPGPSVPQWAGYCHAWSASAVLENEPKQPKSVRGVTLAVGDQKGWLAAAHSQDVANFFGQRNNGTGADDFQDVYPDVLWRALKLYVKQQGVPLIIDLDPGPAVWNYPVYAYRVRYSPAGAGQFRGQLELWMADDLVPVDFVGLKPKYQTYQFTFRMQGGSVVAGSARWTGLSERNHPDFAWYPYIVRPENPQVQYAKVKELLQLTSNLNPPIVPGPTPGSTPGTGPGTTPPGTAPGTLPGTTPGRVPGTPPRTRPPVVDPSGLVADGAALQSAVFLSPTQLLAVIARKPRPAFGLHVTVDRFHGGKYAVGDPMQVTATSSRAGYLYLFCIKGEGDLLLLYPDPGQDNYVEADARTTPLQYRTGEPFGTHRIRAVVTSRPLVLSGLGAGDQNFKQQQGRTFQWHPAQQQQCRELLSQYQRNEELKPAEVDGIDPAGVLGEYSHAEVAYYVGPADNGPAKKK